MTFIKHLGAFVDALGVENADLAWGLAKVQWPSDDDRDAFIGALTAESADE